MERRLQTASSSRYEGCDDALAESAREGTARAKWLQERRLEREDKVAKARAALAKSQACVTEAQAAFNRLVTASGHRTEDDLKKGFKLMHRGPPKVTGETSQSANLGRLREEARPREEEQPAVSAASSSSTNDAAQPVKRPRHDTTTTTAPQHCPLQGLPVDVIGCVASYLPTKSAVAGLACTCKALHAHVFASLERVVIRYMMCNLNKVVASFPRLSHLVVICRKGLGAVVEGYFPHAWLKDLEVQLHERLTGLEVVLEGQESRDVVAWLCQLDWPKLELLHVQRHLPLVLRAAKARPLTFLPNLHTIGSRAITPPASPYSRPSTRETDEDTDDDGSDAQVTAAELMGARSKGHLPKLQRVIQPDNPPCRVGMVGSGCVALMDYLTMTSRDIRVLDISSASSYYCREDPAAVEENFHQLLSVLRSTKLPRLRCIPSWLENTQRAATNINIDCASGLF